VIFAEFRERSHFALPTERLADGGNVAAPAHQFDQFIDVLLVYFAHDEASKTAKPKEIEQLRMVKGCFTNAGQFQVVIGTEVGDYYKALLATTGQAIGRSPMTLRKPRIRPPLISAGRSGKKISAKCEINRSCHFIFCRAACLACSQTLAQMHPSLKTIYDFLWLIGEAIFFYLPVGICWSAVKKIGGTPILGIVLGVTLVSPA
jgi:PTS system trehalose-specific IIC component